MTASASLPRLAAAPSALDLKVEGMTCASCVARVEKALRKVPGVMDASVNLATETATVRADVPVTDAAIAAIRKVGYEASTLSPGLPQEGRATSVGEWARVAIAAILTAPLGLMIGLPAAAKEHLVEVARSEMGDYKVELRIAPGKFKELCVALKKGERVEWSFSSPVDTSFNIHYHVGSDVSYPAKVDGIRAAQGALEVKIDQDYCWLWKAGADPVQLVASLKLHAERRQ